MKICFFTKYPPTEGGTASRSYWLARALGERGIEVHIVTNALEEKDFREKIDFEDLDDLANFQPKNVYVHSLDALNPKRQDYESRLASIGIEVIERYQCNIIDSYYLLPYGVAAYLAKKNTNRPLILRHAGSDIAHIIRDRTLHPLFRKIFFEADLIFTQQPRILFFQELGIPYEKLYLGFQYDVDSKYFNPQVLPADLSKYGLNAAPDLPIITYIGKVFPFKGIYELVEAANQIKGKFLLLFVAGGPTSEDFKRYIEKFSGLKGKYHFLGFVPPWKIPAILKRSRCLVHLERDFPVSSHLPIQPLEALAVGTCLIISEEIYVAYKNSLKFQKNKNILIVNPKNIKELNNALEKIIKEKKTADEIGREGQKIFNPEVFPDSVSQMMKIYENLNNGNKSLRICLEELKSVILKYL